MDFQSILHAATRNTLERKNPVKCLQTKFKPPTKEQREKDRILSNGVAKYLARKEEEEKRRKAQLAKSREELAARRALDPKSHRRIQTMLKRTKSANRSVMDDAVDSENTAVTLTGPSQPDEDDYGFVSETSSALYDQIIKKMYSQPDDDKPRFSKSGKPSGGSITSTKERVKQALMRQEEEERLPHRKKKKDELVDEKPPENLKNDKSKSKLRPAPAIDFIELLKLAEKKQYEPIVIEKKIKEPEPEQLLTKKQKEEQEKLLQMRKQKEERLKLAAAKKISKPPSSKEEKKTSVASKGAPAAAAASAAAAAAAAAATAERKLSGLDLETERLKRERDEALQLLKQKEEEIKKKEAALRLQREKEQLIREKNEALKKLQQLEELQRKNVAKLGSAAAASKIPIEKPLARNASENRNVNANKQKPPLRKPISREQLEMLRRKKRKIESDSEYDSELDDFIDDGPVGDVPEEEVSKVISQIFRYDKNKYRRNDDVDDECMESDWKQISREEFYSAKCGLVEDLKEIQAEKRALARKKFKK